MKIYNSSEITGAPLSGAYEVNNFIFISGQIHRNNQGILVEGSIMERFKVVMNNIESILKQAGLSKKNIIKVSMYLTNLEELSELNQFYINYFENPLPVRTTVEVKSLPLGATLEMEVIAFRS